MVFVRDGELSLTSAIRQVSGVDHDQATTPYWIVNGKLLRGDFF
jgi:hypothetical protein